MSFDLHCHSTASDGALSPTEVIMRAASQGVTTLALTDHDSLSGVAEASTAARAEGVRLVTGAEISVTWEGRTVHIVGLHIDPHHPELQAGLARVRSGRQMRAERMSESLAAVGISGALEGAYAFAGQREMIGRTHFARFLVQSGRASNMASVFRKFLVPGKPGFVKHAWADLPDVVRWINAAGGQAVLAHPGRYDLGQMRMAQLLGEFRDLGGVGIEVVAGSHAAGMVPRFADFSVEYGLKASVGSDFHAPGEGGRELGRLPTLPARCTPIWQDW